MTEAVLVAGGGKGIIRNSRFTERMVTRKNGEGRRQRRIKNGGRSFPRNFSVTLNPRQLAAGIQHHLLILRRRSDRQRNDQSHRILERRSVIVGNIRFRLRLRDQRRREYRVFRERRRERKRSEREGETMVRRDERSEEEEEEEEEEVGGSHSLRRW